MSWILDHLNIVIVGVLVLVSFLKSRFDSVKQENQEPDDFPDYGESFPDNDGRSTPPPMPYVPPTLESSNVPARRQPAPPVATTTYTTSGAFSDAAEETAKALKHQQDLAARLLQIRKTKTVTTGGAALTRSRLAASNRLPKPLASGPLSLRSRLKNPVEVRRAFVLKEILDPPVGLR